MSDDGWPGAIAVTVVKTAGLLRFMEGACVGRLSIDFAAKVVKINEHPLSVGEKAFKIIEMLAKYAGEPVTQGTLMIYLYGRIDDRAKKALGALIRRLRMKIAQATGGEHYIMTVWGAGYVLRNPDIR